MLTQEQPAVQGGKKVDRSKEGCQGRSGSVCSARRSTGARQEWKWLLGQLRWRVGAAHPDCLPPLQWAGLEGWWLSESTGFEGQPCEELPAAGGLGGQEAQWLSAMQKRGKA